MHARTQGAVLYIAKETLTDAGDAAGLGTHTRAPHTRTTRARTHLHTRAQARTYTHTHAHTGPLLKGAIAGGGAGACQVCMPGRHSPRIVVGTSVRDYSLGHR